MANRRWLSHLVETPVKETGEVLISSDNGLRQKYRMYVCMCACVQRRGLMQMYGPSMACLMRRSDGN